MKFPTLFISAACLASIVSAQNPIVSITSPLANTHYKVGTEAIISWVNPSVPTISQIVLAKGPPTGLQPVMTIATNVNAGDLKYTWKVPEDLPSGSDYAFEFGTSPDIAFTGAFNIEGGSSGSLPSQNATSGTAASSSASASSASASASSVSSSSAVSSSSPSSASVSSAASSAPSVSNSGSSIGSASTPAISSGTSNTQVSPSASASHSTSSASKEVSAGQTMVAVGLAAIVVAQQFF